MAKMLNIALCESRHDMPACVVGSVFDNTVNPLDVDGLQTVANEFFATVKVDIVNLYVTGLTVALICVLNACRKYGLKVVLYHFNRETGNYYPQYVD